MDFSNCSLCGSKVRLAQISFTEAIYLCENIKCTYPFQLFESNTVINFVKRDFTELKKQETNMHSDRSASICSSVTNSEDKDFLDSFFTGCSSVDVTDYDIQAVDSIFEELQNYKHQN